MRRRYTNPTSPRLRFAIAAIMIGLITACGSSSSEDEASLAESPTSESDQTDVEQVDASASTTPEDSAESEESEAGSGDSAFEVGVPDISFPDIEFPVADIPNVDLPAPEFPDPLFPEPQFPVVDFPEVTFDGVITQQGDDVAVYTLEADVLFDFDSAELRPEAQDVLEEIAASISVRAGGTDIRVNGHTDAIGSEDYNVGLSERRAASVAEFLQDLVDSEFSFEVAGFGESRPVAPNAGPNGEDDPAGRQQNRRVEIVVEL